MSSMLGIPRRRNYPSRISLSIDDAITVHGALRHQLYQSGTHLSRPLTYDLAGQDEHYDRVQLLERRISDTCRLGRSPDFRIAPNASPW